MSTAFKLKNGSIFLSTEAPGGIYNASQLKKIASLCDGESVLVKATEDQRLALVVNPEKAPAIAAELQAIGLGIRHYQHGLHQPVSCVGEMCESHEQDALGSALDISTEIEGIKLETPLKIGINGCAKCCVPCHTLDISVVGDGSGYKISLGGKSSQLPELASFVAEAIPATELPRLVKNLVDLYSLHARGEESLQELIERVGVGVFVKVLAPWSQDAADSDDPFSQLAHSPLADETPTVPSLESTKDDLVTVAGEDTIEHAQLLDLEIQELTLDDAPLNMGDLGEERDINLSAGDQGYTLEDLSEIPVDSSSDLQSLHIPIDTQFSAVPEINMLNGELAKDVHHDESVPSNAENPENPELTLESSEIESGFVEDEAEIEAKLNARINAQHDLMVADQLDSVEAEEGNELLASTELTLSGGNTADDNDMSQEEVAPPESQSIVDGAGDQEREDLGDDHNELDSKEYDDRQDDEAFDVHDHLPLSEVVATRKIQPRTKNISSNKWSIAGFDMDEHGLPIITWSNGVVLTLTAEAVGHGSLSFGGHEIRISHKNSGIQVELDGMKMFLPVAA